MNRQNKHKDTLNLVECAESDFYKSEHDVSRFLILRTPSYLRNN